MTTSVDENKALVRRFFAVIESGDLTAFDQIVAADYNDHLPGQSPGRETLKQYFKGLHSAFSDLTLPISAIVGEGDLVAVYNSVKGTHKGEFGTIKATGNQIDAMAFQLYRVANGQLAEHWEVADFMTLMGQLEK